jgi:hypothetical protein
MTLQRNLIALLVGALTLGAANAETIRVAIGTQDTTINCATGGLLIRELKLLEKYLPRDGKYKDAHLRHPVEELHLRGAADQRDGGRQTRSRLDGRLSRLLQRRRVREGR